MEDALVILPHLLYPGVVVPAVLALVILLGVRFLNRTPLSSIDRVGGTLALSACFLGCFFVFSEWMHWRPTDPLEWFPYLVVLAGIVDLVALWQPIPRPVSWLLRVAVAFASAWILWPPEA